jgi:hypothetical protein
MAKAQGLQTASDSIGGRWLNRRYLAKHFATVQSIDAKLAIIKQVNVISLH